MPDRHVCPNCGCHELRRAHRKGAWERLVGNFGLYPYTCHDCSHHFLRHRPGAGSGYLVAAVWLVCATVLAGAAWWFWQERPLPVKTVQAAARPDHGRLDDPKSGNQFLRQSLADLRQVVGKLARQKQELQKELVQVSRSLAATQKAPAPKPSPQLRQRLEQLSALNRRLRSELELQQRSLDDLNQQKEALQKLLAQKASAPAPAEPQRGLVATISFGPGRTQLGAQARAQLNRAAGSLRNRPRHGIVVEGNADSTPLGAATAKLYYDNAGVALARALSVFRALRDMGVDPLRMEAPAPGAPAKGPDAGRTVSVWLVERPG
ncbi:MAG: OmpA family protein [Desulfarculaceae bacterium]|nr:OmpA family protein [Desulfarculaceae bacterium]